MPTGIAVASNPYDNSILTFQYDGVTDAINATGAFLISGNIIMAAASRLHEMHLVRDKLTVRYMQRCSLLAQLLPMSFLLPVYVSPPVRLQCAY